MRARGTVSKHHQARILKAKAAAEKSQQAYRDAVRDAALDPAEPASVRELAKLTGLAASTVQLWKSAP